MIWKHYRSRSTGAGAGNSLALRVWLARHELADCHYKFIDARVRLAKAAVGFAEPPVRLAVARGGFLRECLNSLAEPVVDFDYLDGKFVELALCVAPKGAELFAILAAFLGQAEGDVFDAFEALFGGHDFFSIAPGAYAGQVCQPAGRLPIGPVIRP